MCGREGAGLVAGVESTCVVGKVQGRSPRVWEGRCTTSGKGGVHVCGREGAGLVAREESAYVGGEVQD